ncbi:PAP2 family protein [Chondromyces apiculatus DSM 436]|uniref:PAP2 family protein n=1 Tax=Chondromyces apiculatus DSM 436 TaxID=1192034 RepID=A0A017T9Y7_9BACT|nr:PAP2 family protein [Chondromyces apiculatus DSM 436]
MEDAALPSAPVLKGVLALFTLQDGLLIGYLFAILALLAHAEASAMQAQCTQRTMASIVVMVLGCVFARGATSVSPAIRSVVYKTVLPGIVLMNYLTLRDVLPIIRTDSLDMQLLQFDLAVFGVEPALWLERFNRRPIVEWFSFFYFSYFFICGFYMLLAVWLRPPTRHTTEFAVGTALVYCLGQLGYMAVPGYGPIGALKHLYQGPVDGGFFWGCVMGTVQAGGAMKDIFPSLHTAAPLWFALWAFNGVRYDKRFLPLAVVTAFFSFNIIISTMLLRWHYVIDVLAGLTLAVSASVLSVKLARWEETFRKRLGETQSWFFT